MGDLARGTRGRAGNWQGGDEMVEGKNIVITGCLQGIGRETLRAFAEDGANVVACALARDGEFEGFCGDLAGANHVKIVPVYFDMADGEAVRGAARAIQKEGMEIHGLVNIAGINRDALFGMVTQEDLAATFQVNVFSQILFSQYIARLMQRRGTRGSIAFTSSITALDGSEGQTAYGASMAALIGAMRTMAIELGKSGIRVNAVAPGVIRSPMTDALERDTIERKIGRMEIPRLGEAREVAEAYEFLMSDLSSHVTGQTIRIDGGIG